ncbi:hypothetical protein V3C99_017909 [Haemonchus contortus]
MLAQRLIGRLLFNSEDTVHPSDEEREEFRIAEDGNFEDTEYAVGLMIHVRFPAILCITVSSLLKSTRPRGLFHELPASCKIIIGNDASQISEPAFAAMVSQFPAARHIYLGDAHQLPPHLLCPASSRPARLRARSIMDILLDRDVPLAPLVTTCRAHPSPNSLLNRLVYIRALVSEIGLELVRRNISVPISLKRGGTMRRRSDVCVTGQGFPWLGYRNGYLLCTRISSGFCNQQPVD